MVLVSDQLTKIAARANLQEGESVPVFSNFNLTLVYNPGAAFGMFSNLPTSYRLASLLTVSILALVVVFWFLRNDAKGDYIAELSLSAILGGAAGNIIDRFLYGAVVDFLDFYVGNYHWPAFNVADSAICIGVTLLLLRLVFAGEERFEQNRDDAEIVREAQ